MHQPQFIIFDFGSQFTHLILRMLRHLELYCTIEAPHPSSLKTLAPNTHIKGIILSGGPRTVTKTDVNFVKRLLDAYPETPVLGICYGMQLLAKAHGQTLHQLKQSEYGPEFLNVVKKHPLFKRVPRRNRQVWMSHGDHVTLNKHSDVTPLAYSTTKTLAAVAFSEKIVGVQFHPEVTHTKDGERILRNFCFEMAKPKKDWDKKQIFRDANDIIHETIVKPKRKVLCAVSGGVDSTVLAKVLHKTCPKQVHFIHIDHGLGRDDESKQVIQSLRKVGIPVKLIRAKKQFLDKLAGIKNPERKRKIIGHTFIETFDTYARKHKLTHLVQGTLYPDRIESRPQVGKSSVIKTHHNVGGIPKNCRLGIVEPFQHFYKDDVRELGNWLKLPSQLVQRHPFPGPGLAIRILGDVTEERLRILRDCDKIMIAFLKDKKLYEQIWQAGCILLPVKSVGVKGDKRAYQPVIAMRCVTSQNAMTANAARVDIEQLEECATKILNQVPDVGRVVYDVSPKPPATIEWE